MPGHGISWSARPTSARPWRTSRSGAPSWGGRAGGGHCWGRVRHRGIRGVLDGRGVGRGPGA
eukprot:904127-Lingulodinium_polyedra.AAC.1